MTLTTPTRRLRRTEASEYLKETWGIDRAPATLAKLATIGGGPKFEKANRIPLYAPQFLDEWARSILSPPMTSTSDTGRTVDGRTKIGPVRPPASLRPERRGN
jgi:hypothetical protein